MPKQRWVKLEKYDRWDLCPRCKGEIEFLTGEDDEGHEVYVAERCQGAGTFCPWTMHYDEDES